MAYNYNFPVGYQPMQMYQAPQAPQTAQAPQMQNNSSIIWVQGEAGAKSYLVAPNTTVQLWDSEAQVIYLKSADASGMPSIKILDYTVRDAQNANLRAFSNDNELVDIKKRISAIESRLEVISNGKQQSDTKSDEV